jgi:hypothetical protein
VFENSCVSSCRSSVSLVLLSQKVAAAQGVSDLLPRARLLVEGENLNPVRAPLPVGERPVGFSAPLSASRRADRSAIGSCAAAWPVVAGAQQLRNPVIGFLHPSSAEAYASQLLAQSDRRAG